MEDSVSLARPLIDSGKVWTEVPVVANGKLWPTDELGWVFGTISATG
jgi:hypothetical protein